MKGKGMTIRAHDLKEEGQGVGKKITRDDSTLWA